MKHFNQIELARRWSLSHRTLERWRWAGGGPSFLKLGNRVIYRLEDIEAFERQQLRSRGCGTPGSVKTCAERKQT